MGSYKQELTNKYINPAIILNPDIVRYNLNDLEIWCSDNKVLIFSNNGSTGFFSSLKSNFNKVLNIIENEVRACNKINELEVSGMSEVDQCIMILKDSISNM